MKRSICLPSSLLAALLLLSVASGATETHAGRKLVWDPICAALDTGCSVSCAGSGYELYTYDCSSDTCKCFNNQVAAVIDKAKSCFPGDALVHTPGGGRKPMSELRVGDKVLTVKPSGEIEYNTVSGTFCYRLRCSRLRQRLYLPQARALFPQARFRLRPSGTSAGNMQGCLQHMFAHRQM
jgi:hypothetical protein